MTKPMKAKQELKPCPVVKESLTGDSKAVADAEAFLRVIRTQVDQSRYDNKVVEVITALIAANKDLAGQVAEQSSKLLDIKTIATLSDRKCISVERVLYIVNRKEA